MSTAPAGPAAGIGETAVAEKSAMVQDAAVIEETAVAEEMAQLWGRLLNLRTVPRDETFPALGGDSLLLLAMLTEIEARFGVFLGAEDILDDLTVDGVARALIRVRDAG